MSTPTASEQLLDRLEGWGFPHAEIYTKRGRSRRFELGSQGRLAFSSVEEGWAVRGGNSAGSFFISGTGPLPEDYDWPRPSGPRLRLPLPEPIPSWAPHPDLDSPLTVEAEAMALLESCERQLGNEAKGARMSKALLEEGLSEIEIHSSTGVHASYRTRTVSVFLRALAAKADAEASVLIAERDARRLRPVALASRLANRLAIAEHGKKLDRDRGEIVLSPTVGAAILRGLMPMLLGVEGFKAANRLRDRGGRIGSELLSIVDHGRLENGVLAAPVDGEGRPTGEAKLVSNGVFKQPLLAWNDARQHHLRPIGCRRRDSWRELPELAPSHLYILPRLDVSARSLIEQVARGFYLFAADGAGEFDLDNDHFRLPVCGFALRQGRAVSPIAGCVLSGKISALLHGIQAIGRDLDFEPLRGMLGSPSLLLAGMELKGR